MPRSVRVLLRNGDEKTFENAEFQVDHPNRILTVYYKDWDNEPEASQDNSSSVEREKLADFSIDTIRFYEYFIEE
ncbi:MAG: hypothetical protein O7G88_19800 [bacterium]|nr:hypothetical protein [bacterium]